MTDRSPDRDHLDRMAHRFHQSRIAQTMQMQLRYDEAARAVVQFDYRSDYDHIFHDVHGGVIATLIDNAGWFAAAAWYPTWIVTVEMQVRLLEPAGCTGIRGVGEVVRTGGRIAVTTMSVLSDDDRLVAMGSGTFAVTKGEYES